MKKGFVLFSSLILLAVTFFVAKEFSKTATGGNPPSASRNGDANGDGQLDIADAVYLLLHLFKGGPEPVALADPPEILARLDSLEGRTTALEANTGLLQGNLAELNSRISKVAFLLSGSFPFIFQEDCAPGDLPETLKRPLGVIDVLNEYVAVLRKGEILSDRITFTTDREADLLFEIGDAGGMDTSFLFSVDGLNIGGIVGTPRLIRAIREKVQPGEHVITLAPWPGIPCGSIRTVGFTSIIVHYLD